MFIAQPSGRVVVNFNISPVPQWCVLLSLREIDLLLTGAIKAFQYAPEHVALFDISLAFMVPLLLSGRVKVRNYRLLLPRAALQYVLEWGLSIGYTPAIDGIEPNRPFKWFTIDMFTMSTKAAYAQYLWRLRTASLRENSSGFRECCAQGLEWFRQSLGVRLLQVQRDLSSLLRSSPVVHCSHLDPHPTGRFPYGGYRFHNVLSSSKLSVLARYYNSVALPGLKMEFWHFAGLSMPHRSEEYLANSYIQKMLQ
nr:P0 protein [Wheat yellow dwarf virus]